MESYEQFTFFMKYGKILKPSNYAENDIRIDSEI